MIVHLFNSSVVSGPETLVIPALKNLGREVSVIFLTETRRGESGRSPIEYAKGFGLTVYEVSVKKRFDNGAISELKKLLQRLSPEIVHAHDVKASTYLWLASRGLKNIKLVSTHHGILGRVGFKIKLYERFYSYIVLPHFDAVLAVCSVDRDILLKRGLSQRKVLLHLNGVDRPLVPANDKADKQQAIRQSWGIQGDEVLIGHVARLAPEKNIDRLLNVIRILKNKTELPKFKVLFFGRGSEEEHLKQLSQTYGIEDQVSWMGYRNGVGYEAAGFDLIVSLSKGEGLPINLLEAGWGGTAVLCTAVGGNRDLINWDDGVSLLEDGWTDDEAAEKLSKLIGDPDLRLKLAQRFQERVKQQFSERAWIDRLLEIYREL